MRYSICRNYSCGYDYGICVDDINMHDVGRLQTLLELAPRLKAKIDSRFSQQRAQEPSWNDYMELDLGLATILKEAIAETEGINLTACDDYDNKTYLLYQPMYPRENVDCGMTEERVAGILRHYIGILTDDPIEIDYQEVENGG